MEVQKHLENYVPAEKPLDAPALRTAKEPATARDARTAGFTFIPACYRPCCFLNCISFSLPNFFQHVVPPVGVINGGRGVGVSVLAVCGVIVLIGV